MTNKEVLKKKILYRSTHRGSKEMDILLGSFVKKHINSFNLIELNKLMQILFIDDEILYKWYFNKKINKTIPKSSILKMLENFKI